MRALYLTHPQVRIDPAVPVPQWGLADIGRTRAEAFAARDVVPANTAVFASNERKAQELAEIITARIGGSLIVDPAMGENDRSATGFLPPEQFEATADRFFAERSVSVDGWERAIDAQIRIVVSVTAAMGRVQPGQTAVFCGHGAVGTLLKCYMAKREIARAEDQSRRGNPGGGNGFVFDLRKGRLFCDWTAFEDLTAELIAGA